MVLTATFLRLPPVASPKVRLGNNRSIGMASATLTTFFTLPSRRSSQIRRSCAFLSKFVYAASAHLAINNDASVLSENFLVKADAVLKQANITLQRGLERAEECKYDDGEDMSLVRRKEGNVYVYAISELFVSANGNLVDLLKVYFREFVIGSLVFTLVCLPDANAHALGPGGPLMEEFWDNVRRYGLYFFTVVSGGLYSLAKPLVDLLKEPSTQFLVAIAVAGTFYLIYLTVSTMLGLTDFDYQYTQ